MNNLIAALQQARKPKPRRVQREHPFQTSAIQYLGLALPPEAIFTSIDHANASAVANALNAARGVLPGIPDILVLWSPDPLARLFVVVLIETKAKDGRLSTSQKVWGTTLIGQGAYWCAPRTLEEVAACLAETPIPLRPVRL